MINDNLEVRGFISKDQILAHVSEEEIYELVFGFKPVEFEYVTSPFREDNNPGCWFETDFSTGKLRFKDFSETRVIKGIKLCNMDCFNVIQVYYNLPNFFKTLEFVKNKLIKGKNINFKPKFENSAEIIKKERKETFINIFTIPYVGRDGRYWEPYGISKENLLEDKVFSVSKIQIDKTNKTSIFRPNTNCYAFTNFKNNHKKLYLPYKKGKKRFITNCNENDVGEINSLPDFGEHLIISKSYKDCRVLRNEKDVISVWFQNEGMFPEYEIIIDLCRRFKKITVLFDNDKAGIEAGHKVTRQINTLYKNKASHLYLPERLIKSHNITDPAGLRKTMGPKHLQEFLNEKNLRNITA